MALQWNLDLTKCQGTGAGLGEFVRLQPKPRFSEFLGKQAKWSLYRDIGND